MRVLFLIIPTILLGLSPARAQVPLPGYFIALEACEAFQSKNHLTNPGDVRTVVMRAYEMLGINKAGGDFFQIRMPDAPVTSVRWVHVSCGRHVVEANTATGPDPVDPAVITPPEGAESTENVLAISWQPAFCEIRPGKTECQSLNAGDLPITETRFSIHGLWPQPRSNVYCGVPEAAKQLDGAGRWSELPAVEMDAETREALEVAMPGTASQLERHEWVKHGTCYRAAGGSDEYYDDTLHVVAAINQSSVADFMASHVGGQIATAELRALFDDDFGQGAGDRVQFHCSGDGGRVLIQELTLSLRGQIGPEALLGDLLLAADPVPLGCGSGTVDPAGLQ